VGCRGSVSQQPRQQQQRWSRPDRARRRRGCPRGRRGGRARGGASTAATDTAGPRAGRRGRCGPSRPPPRSTCASGPLTFSLRVVGGASNSSTSSSGGVGSLAFVVPALTESHAVVVTGRLGLTPRVSPRPRGVVPRGRQRHGHVHGPPPVLRRARPRHDHARALPGPPCRIHPPSHL